MKTKHNFKKFQNILDLTSGDIILTTRVIHPKDLNFKKTASTWWGKHFSSVDNMSKDKRVIPAFSILFIFTQTGFVNYHGFPQIWGYKGGFNPFEEDEFTVNTYDDIYEYDKCNTIQRLFLALECKKAKVMKYDLLMEVMKNEFELDLLRSRIYRGINKNGLYLYFDDRRILFTSAETRLHNNAMIINGYFDDTKRVAPEMRIEYNQLKNYNFTTPQFSEISINGNPFDKQMLIYFESY